MAAQNGKHLEPDAPVTGHDYRAHYDDGAEKSFQLTKLTQDGAEEWTHGFPNAGDWI